MEPTVEVTTLPFPEVEVDLSKVDKDPETACCPMPDFVSGSEPDLHTILGAVAGAFLLGGAVGAALAFAFSRRSE